MSDNHRSGEGEEVVARLISLLLDSTGNQKAKLTVFVGAGASREYGMPTTIEFARLFFQDAVSKSPDVNFASTEQIETFIREFRAQLDTDLAYAFFRKVESEKTSKAPTDTILTYDRIIDLWRNGYVKLVVTTNFDSLLERRFEAYTTASSDSSMRLAVFDYNDLKRRDGPKILDARILVKIAGQIDRSNMLWTDDEFSENITPTVQSWIEQAIAETPLLLLGYTASEAPLAEVLARHGLYAASVAPRELTQIPSLSSLAESRASKLDHAETTAGSFVELLYERLFERTKDPDLALSFGRLKQRVNELSDMTSGSTMGPELYIERERLEAPLSAFLKGEDVDKHRLRILLGDSGMGKSTLLRKSVPRDEHILSLIVPASEVTHTLNEWAERLGGTSLEDICRLSIILDRSVNIVVDGLNEVIDPSRARDILEELKMLLDRFNDHRVRGVVCSRTDSWSRLRHSTKRDYIGTPWVVDGFDPEEESRALGLLTRNGVVVGTAGRWGGMLSLPQNYAFALELKQQRGEIVSETELLSRLFEHRAGELGQHISVLYWLCRQLRTAQTTSLGTEDTDISQRRLDGLRALADVGIIQLNRSLVVRFCEDRFAEFAFGARFLLENELRDQSSEPSAALSHFVSLCAEYQQIPNSNGPFKAMFLNALVFYLCEIEEFEFRKIYQASDPAARMLARVAAQLKLNLTYDPSFRDDPILVAVCLRSKHNHQAFIEDLGKGEIERVQSAPFSFTAKLFPDAFLTFVESLLELLLKSNGQHRSNLSMVMVSLLIVALRSGIRGFMGSYALRRKLLDVVQAVPKPLLTSRVVEALVSNSSLIFHHHPSAKLSDITKLNWRMKQDLNTAIDGSIYDLSIRSIARVISHSPPPRHVVRFLVRRDLNDPRFDDWLKRLFETGDLAVQDFCMGILGFQSKRDINWLVIAKTYVARQRTEYKRNFFRKRMPGQTSKEAQYDPIVPIATTILHHAVHFDLDEFIPDRSVDAGYRVGRLAQKTVLDFPNQTLAFVQEFLDSGGALHPQIKIALQICARFFPAVYWKHMRAFAPGEMFEVLTDQTEDSTWVVSQVRDYDWQELYEFMAENDERCVLTTKMLNALINSDDLEDWVGKGVDWLRTVAPDLLEEDATRR